MKQIKTFKTLLIKTFLYSYKMDKLAYGFLNKKNNRK